MGFLNEAFKSGVKIKMLIFVTMHKTTGSDLVALTAQNRSIFCLKPHSFTAFAKELLSPEKFFGRPHLLGATVYRLM